MNLKSSVLSSPVSDAGTWRHLRDRFVAHSFLAKGAYKLIEQENANEYFLLAPFALASAIETYGFLAPDQNSLRIAILGAEQLDCGLGGRLYSILPWLLGRPDLKVSVELVGPKYQPPKSKYGVEFGLRPGKSFSKTCGQWLRDRPEPLELPDFFCAFHPGFESHSAEWLKEGELPAVLKLGKPLLVFSYDRDEAERDGAILRAHGAEEVSDPLSCPMQADFGQSDGSVMALSFAANMFTVRGYDERLSDAAKKDALVELVAALQTIIMHDHRLERHTDAFKHYPIIRNGEPAIAAHIFGPLYLDPEKKELFLAAQGEELPGASVSIDCPSIGEILAEASTPIERAMLAAGIWMTFAAQNAEAA